MFSLCLDFSNIVKTEPYLTIPTVTLVFFIGSIITFSLSAGDFRYGYIASGISRVSVYGKIWQPWQYD